MTIDFKDDIFSFGNIDLSTGNTVDGVDLNNPINSIQISGTSYQLVGDIASPGNNQVYGTNAAGVRTWIENATGDLAAVTAQKTGNQAIGNGSFTTISFQTNAFENDSTTIDHSGTINNSRITVFETGTYLCSYNLTMDPPTALSQMDARVILNGVATPISGSARTVSNDDEPINNSNTFALTLNANDYIEVQAQSNQGGSSVNAQSTFTLVRLRGIRGEKGEDGAPGAGSSINIEDDGTLVTGSPFSTLNFINSSITNAGGGQADITIENNLSKAILNTNENSDNTINYNNVADTTVQLSLQVQVDSPDFSWNAGNNQLTCNFDGLVFLGYHVSTISGGGRNSVNIRIIRDGISPEEQYCESYTYIRNSSGHSRDSRSSSGWASVQNGDTLRLSIRKFGSNSAATNLQDRCEFFAMRIE